MLFGAVQQPCDGRADEKKAAVKNEKAITD
jgi:hypothetical protein